jgi:hypothetical protein
VKNFFNRAEVFSFGAISFDFGAIRFRLGAIRFCFDGLSINFGAIRFCFDGFSTSFDGLSINSVASLLSDYDLPAAVDIDAGEQLAVDEPIPSPSRWTVFILLAVIILQQRCAQLSDKRTKNSDNIAVCRDKRVFLQTNKKRSENQSQRNCK